MNRIVLASVCLLLTNSTKVFAGAYEDQVILKPGESKTIGETTIHCQARSSPRDLENLSDQTLVGLARLPDGIGTCGAEIRVFNDEHQSYYGILLQKTSGKWKTIYSTETGSKKRVIESLAKELRSLLRAGICDE